MGVRKKRTCITSLHKGSVGGVGRHAKKTEESKRRGERVKVGTEIYPEGRKLKVKVRSSAAPSVSSCYCSAFGAMTSAWSKHET